MDQKTQIYAVLGVVALVLGFVIIGFLFGGKDSGPATGDLTFWGFGEDADEWRDILTKFEKEIGGTVTYVKFDEDSYEDILLNSLAAGAGPDVVMLKSRNIIKQADKLLPLPQQTFQFFVKDLRNNFVELSAEELVAGPRNGFLPLETEEILGLPLYLDTLALFYNKDMFNSAGIATPPKTWDEFLEDSRRLTKYSSVGGIERSGVAFGTFLNIERAFEIFSALLMQSGDNIVSREDKNILIGGDAAKSMQFFTSFADPTRQSYSWNSRFPDAFEAFARGDTAMVFGTASDLASILEKNPHVRIGVAGFPQSSGSDYPVTYGEDTVLAVSRSSKNPEAAWQFILYMTGKEPVKEYLELTKRAPARRDLIAEGTQSSESDIFYGQGLIAKNWPVSDASRSKKIFSDAIESVVTRLNSPEEAVSNMSQQLQLIIQR